MTELLKLIFGVLASLFKSRAKLEAEIVMLRQQINVLRRRAPQRPHLNNTDRFLFVWLYRWFPSILGAIAIVRPETIIRWHRAGFRAYWRWRSRNRIGRPRVSAELQSLGICAATRGHHLKAGARFSATMPTASRPSTFLSFQRSRSRLFIALSSFVTDDGTGCRLA
jgi:hypothetical protein